MSKAPWILVYILLLILHLIFVLSQMQIGQTTLPQDISPLDTAYFLAETSFLGVQRNNILSLDQALKQNIVIVNTATELIWLTFILKDLHLPLSSLPILYYDNLSALHIKVNPVFHAHNKHIELDYHFVCGRVALGLLIT